MNDTAPISEVTTPICSSIGLKSVLATRSASSRNIAPENMEAGNELSALTRRTYKIVTLDGEVIHRGGSMTGGKMKRSTTPITAAREAEEIRRSIDAQTARVELARRESEKAINEREEITRRLQQTRIDAASLEPVVDAKQAKYDKLKNDLALLAPYQLSDSLPEEEIDDTVIRLNRAYSDRDRITSDIKSKRERRLVINSEIDRKEQQIRQLRKHCLYGLLRDHQAERDMLRIDAVVDRQLLLRSITLQAVKVGV